MALDFHVDIDHLITLHDQLSGLQSHLATGPAATSASRGTLDPRVGATSSLIRANPGTTAPFAYGLLTEAGPLGQAHEQVAQSLSALVTDLQDLIDALRQRAALGAGNYSEADAHVMSEINKAARTEEGTTP